MSLHKRKIKLKKYFCWLYLLTCMYLNIVICFLISIVTFFCFNAIFHLTSFTLFCLTPSVQTTARWFCVVLFFPASLIPTSAWALIQRSGLKKCHLLEIYNVNKMNNLRVCFDAVVFQTCFRHCDTYKDIKIFYQNCLAQR